MPDEWVIKYATCASQLFLQSPSCMHACVRAGTLGSEMYLLQYGSVQVVLPDETVVAQLEDGSFFGGKASASSATYLL